MKNSLNFNVDSYNTSNCYDQTYSLLNDYKGEARFINKMIEGNCIDVREIYYLEFGCGTGNLISCLDRSVRCVGVDISKRMIELAKLKIIANAEFVQADIEGFRTTKKFDVIVISTYLLQTFPTIEAVIKFLQYAQTLLTITGVILFTWIDGKSYMNTYRNGGFCLEKGGWELRGRAKMSKGKLHFHLRFEGAHRECIESSAIYLYLSTPILNRIAKQLGVQLSTYRGEANGLHETYQRWAVLRSLKIGSSCL